MNYKIYIQIGGTTPEEIALNGDYQSIPEDEVNDVMDTFCGLRTCRIGLANGMIVAIPEAKMRDVLFLAMPVKE